MIRVRAMAFIFVLTASIARATSNDSGADNFTTPNTSNTTTSAAMPANSSKPNASSSSTTFAATSIASIVSSVADSTNISVNRTSAMSSLIMSPNVLGANETGNRTSAMSTDLGCEGLLPRISAYENYNAIMGCLTDGLFATLQGGVFHIPRGLSLPPHSALLGAGVQSTVLRIASRVAARGFVLRTSRNCSVNDITFDGADNLAAGEWTSVVKVYGSGSRVSDVHAINVRNGIGVYFPDATAVANSFLRVGVRNCYYGVVFEHGLDKDHENSFESGVIEDIICDSVTFAGYGKLSHNLVRNGGFGCVLDGSVIPGAGVRCHGNLGGGLITHNIMNGFCGMIVDVDSCANFNISFNNFSDPGLLANGSYSHCVGATTMTVLDSQHFHIEENDISNHVYTNMQKYSPFGDPNHAFHDVEAPLFSDLPFKESTILNFVIAHRPIRGSPPSIGHSIVANRFHSVCPQPQGQHICSGVGYFAGRGTGFDIRDAWAPLLFYNESVPSVFIANDPLDSDIGSRRCGINQYAMDSQNDTQCLADASPPCNRDDHDHKKTNFRNDGDCEHFAYAIVMGPSSSSSGAMGRGRIRVPLPVHKRTCPSLGAGPIWSC